jgi:D-alanine transaminase
MSIVYLNGNYIPQEKATISIMDRGFLFGDGVYEVIPVFDGHFFGFDEHMIRLEKSLNAVQIKNPHTSQEWKTIFETLLEKNQKVNGNYSCYCQITRGADTIRSHTFPDDLKPTVVAFLTPFKTKTVDQLAQGFSAITSEDTRHSNCFIKAINLLPNILQMQKARSAGAVETILIRDDFVLECTSSNIFIVKNNELITPPLSDNILSGITRQLIIKLARENNIECIETKITPAMLNDADEIWVTGSIKEICPIISLDGKAVGNGQVGPVWKKMINLYEAEKHKILIKPEHS